MEQKSVAEKPISFRDAFAILLPLCLLAVLIAALTISVANDVYAFVKPDEQIEFKIDQPINTKQLAELLQQKGVIENELVFRLYLRTKGVGDKLSDTVGEWILNSNMSYREILLEIF